MKHKIKLRVTYPDGVAIEADGDLDPEIADLIVALVASPDSKRLYGSMKLLERRLLKAPKG